MENKQSPIEARSFTAGVLVSTIMVFIIGILLLLFVGSRTGYGNLYIKIKHVVFPQAATEALQQKKLYLPEGILEELIKLDAVVDNANNPTDAKRHDTILVQPDQELGYVLHKNADIDAYVLKTDEVLNLDPPVLYINSSSRFSTELDNYVNTYSRLSYKYTTTSSGYRNTVPVVESDSKILIVGDSVAFGVGVNDAATTASNLQKMVGESFSVMNTGVGGYSSKQALKIAASLSRKKEYDYLLYVTSQNDFPSGDKYRDENVKNILKGFSSLKDSFPKGVIIAVFPYMEYSLSDVLHESGYSRKRITRLDKIYADLKKYSHEYGLSYIDLKAMIDSYSKMTGTIFSRFSMYADHAHMSPMANRMAAEEIYALLGEMVLDDLTSGAPDSAQ